MSLKLQKEYQKKVRRAFLDSLLIGTETPLKKLDKALKDQATSLQTPLQKALASPQEDMRAAKVILADCMQHEKTEEKSRLNREELLPAIEKSRTLIKDFNLPNRAYTPIANTRNVAVFAFGHAAFSSALPAIIFSTNIDSYISCACIGALIGMWKGMNDNNKYFEYQKKGLRQIVKAFKVR